MAIFPAAVTVGSLIFDTTFPIYWSRFSTTAFHPFWIPVGRRSKIPESVSPICLNPVSSCAYISGKFRIRSLISATSRLIPKYSASIMPASTSITMRADPSFFTIFSRFSSQLTSGAAIAAMIHPMTNGIRNLSRFHPAITNAAVARRLNSSRSATCQYGRLFSILFLHAYPKTFSLNQFPDLIPPLFCR